MKRIFNYLLNIVKNDWKTIKKEWALRSEQKLIQRAIKMAYEYHMSNNKRYYVIRMKRISAMSFPPYLTSGILLKGNTACILLTSSQAQFFVAKKILNQIFWKRRHELSDVFIIDGYFNKKIKADFSKINKFNGVK